MRGFYRALRYFRSALRNLRSRYFGVAKAQKGIDNATRSAARFAICSLWVASAEISQQKRRQKRAICLLNRHLRNSIFQNFGSSPAAPLQRVKSGIYWQCSKCSWHLCGFGKDLDAQNRQNTKKFEIRIRNSQIAQIARRNRQNPHVNSVSGRRVSNCY